MNRFLNSLVYILIALAIVDLYSCKNSETKVNENQEVVKRTTTDPNVLFIVVDDLRPELNCYGASHIKSPSIDKLAAQGVLFEKAYCNVASCGASRASFLTGIRPLRNRYVHYYTKVDEEANSMVTLPEYFKTQGYHTISNSKVFYHPDDAQGSWNEVWMPSNASKKGYTLPENIDKELNEGAGPATESNDVNDTIYNDGKTTNKVLSDLQRLAKIDKPFFLAVGFQKPHLPFCAPKKYWDLYQDSDIKVPVNTNKPGNIPAEAFNNSDEIRTYSDVPDNGPIDQATARNLIKGYYACVSYVDAQVGIILDELDKLGLASNTIVVFVGDNGFNLGEHGLWGNESNFETSFRVPFIIRAPGCQSGQKINLITELLDIYPTLCNLAGLIEINMLEGENIAPILKKSIYRRDFALCKNFDGVSLFMNNFSYTEWSKDSTNVTAKMLFDLKTDPNETNSVLSQQSDIAKEYSEIMKYRKGIIFEKQFPLTYKKKDY